MAQVDPATRLTSTLSSRLPGCSVWVTVDDKPLSVYSATLEDNKSVGYIEAVEGAQFKVHFGDGREEPPATDYAITVWLDGRWVRGKTISKASPAFRRPFGDSHRITSFDARRVSATTERPFIFSKLAQTDDDDLACKDERVVKAIGSIQVRLKRIVKLGRSNRQDGTELSNLVLHEQSKKAQLSHQTSLGPERVAKPSMKTTSKDLDPPDSPHYTFELRYRSRVLLEIEGHAPPLPAPSPPPIIAEESPAADDVPSIDAQQAHVPEATNRKKRTIDLTIDSEDDDDGLTEVERLRAEVARLKAERAGVKVEPEAGRVKEEKKPTLKRVKMEQAGSSGGTSSSPRGKKVKMEVIALD